MLYFYTVVCFCCILFGVVFDAVFSLSSCEVPLESVSLASFGLFQNVKVGMVGYWGKKEVVGFAEALFYSESRLFLTPTSQNI